MSRIQVRDGFLVLMAALWCADESGVLPIFLLAAAVHVCGHLFVIRLSGGTVHALCLTACGAVLRCSLPPSPFSRAAICLAGPAASFALTALANPLGAYRLAGASALLGLFNLLPVPPLDGGMALRHLADVRALETFAITVGQALALGAPLAETLAAQSREIRAAHRAAVEREIERAPVKLLIPTGTLILPALLLSILGPLLGAGGMM